MGVYSIGEVPHREECQNRIRTMGIFSLNPLAMDGKMDPYEFYKRGPGTHEEGSIKDAAVDLASLENE